MPASHRLSLKPLELARPCLPLTPSTFHNLPSGFKLDLSQFPRDCDSILWLMSGGILQVKTLRPQRRPAVNVTCGFVADWVLLPVETIGLRNAASQTSPKGTTSQQARPSFPRQPQFYEFIPWSDTADILRQGAVSYAWLSPPHPLRHGCSWSFKCDISPTLGILCVIPPIIGGLRQVCDHHTQSSLVFEVAGDRPTMLSLYLVHASLRFLSCL